MLSSLFTTVLTDGFFWIVVSHYASKDVGCTYVQDDLTDYMLVRQVLRPEVHMR